MHKLLKVLFICYFFVFPYYAFALEQNEKLWLAVNSQQSLSEDKKWLTFLYSQLRMINQPNPWQSFLIESALGYQFIPRQTLWLGYRWTGHQPGNGFFQENRLFQQIILQTKIADHLNLLFRTRLEEIQRTNAAPIALRLRQRFAIEINRAVLKDLFPFIYEEPFFQLNRTSYTPQNFFGENRFFVGFNWYMPKKTWWEIGYLNQFIIHTPRQPKNRLEHILSVTYNFI